MSLFLRDRNWGLSVIVYGGRAGLGTGWVGRVGLENVLWEMGLVVVGCSDFGGRERGGVCGVEVAWRAWLVVWVGGT